VQVQGASDVPDVPYVASVPVVVAVRPKVSKLLAEVGYTVLPSVVPIPQHAVIRTNAKLFSGTCLVG
jgi:hypothetical protein